MLLSPLSLAAGKWTVPPLLVMALGLADRWAGVRRGDQRWRLYLEFVLRLGLVGALLVALWATH